MSSSAQVRDLRIDNLYLKNTISFGSVLCSEAIAGEQIPKGAILRPSTTVDRQVVQTDSSTDKAVVGVACESAPSAGSVVSMSVGGEFQVLVTGTIARGDFISSSATTGVGESTGTSGQEGDFAIATESSTDAGVKLIWARFKKCEVY